MSRSDTWRHGWLALAFASALALWLPPARAFDLSWLTRPVKGSGQITSTQRALAGFNAVVLELPGQLELVQGNAEGLSLETDDNLHALIETVLVGDELRIRLAKAHTHLGATRLRMTLQVRTLQRLAISGAGDVHAARLAVPQLKLAISGSGDVRLDALDTDALAIALSGSGDVTAAGRADALQASIAGSGDLHLGKLAANSVQVSIAGSGDATVWAAQSLAARIAGSGDVRYYGAARATSQVAGSGSVSWLGAPP